MLKKALGKRLLPTVFHTAVEHIAFGGLDPHIFKGTPPLRKITVHGGYIGGPEASVLGVYFGHIPGRYERVYPEFDLDWSLYGWDHGTQCMIFPSEDPELWVVLHELGHYFDDIYLGREWGWFTSLDCDPNKIVRFVDLRSEMEKEFYATQNAAVEAVTEEACKKWSWYMRIPQGICDRAPSAYGLVNFTEWIAESFRQYFMQPGELGTRCPAASAFMKFALGGEMFCRAAAAWKDSYDFLLAKATSVAHHSPLKLRWVETVVLKPWPVVGKAIVEPWPEDSIVSVEECPPE
jgi:hypothetical protein